MSNTKLPALPGNVSHVMRRIRACESEVPAQIVLEHALHAYAEAAILADRERQAGEAVARVSAHMDLVVAYAQQHHNHRTMPRAETSPAFDAARKAVEASSNSLASLPAPQAVQADNTKMWAVHIIGPDDVHAAPDREVADAACVALNWSFKRTGQDDLCRAEVIEWPHGYESWTAQKDLFQLAAAPSPYGKAEQACRAATLSDGDRVCDCSPGECPDRKAEQAEAPSEEVSQPWYDLAWANNARQHTSYAGDELTEISFTPAQFEAFCSALATQPTASNAGDREDDPTAEELGAFRRKYCHHWNAAENLLIAHLEQQLKCAALATKPPAGEQKPVEGGANYTLTIVADSGYEATTEGRCTAEQYGAAIGALHGVVAQPEQVAQDSEDAENYRWLCSHMIVPAPSLWDNGVGFVTPALPRKSGSMTKAELDDAIRAARARGEKGGAV